MKLKEKFQSNNFTNGIWRIMPSPYLSEIIGIAGFDFQILDCEHGVYDYDSLYKDIIACELHNSSPVIRVSGINKVEVQRCLDLGAQGIVFPQLKNFNDFENAIEQMKYAPSGNRGYNPFVRAGGFGSGPSPETNEPCCIGIIETLTAVEQIEKILKLKSLDMVYIGAYDLSMQLGVQGELQSPQMVSIVDKIVMIAKKNNKPVSLMVHNEEQQKNYLTKGVRSFVHSVDTHKLSLYFNSLVNKTF
jgi:4-hydroxy-2-oxoheptanedioate aldolase